MSKILISLLFMVSTLFANNAEQIIKKVEDNINGKTAKMKISMMVHTKKTKRTMKLETYSIGKTKSFMKVLYPRKDKGITFLKLDKKM